MPYAYVEQINHVYTDTHLNIYVTFRHQMQRSVIPQASPPVYDWYPIPARWLLEADEVPVDIISSEWLDEFTLLLTSDEVLVDPTGVTLEYAGPDEKLCYNWGKQIEPWGPIPSYAGYPTAPALHNSTHENGGSDEINIAGLSGYSEVAAAFLDQSVKIASSPEFASLTIDGTVATILKGKGNGLAPSYKFLPGAGAYATFIAFCNAAGTTVSYVDNYGYFNAGTFNVTTIAQKAGGANHSRIVLGSDDIIRLNTNNVDRLLIEATGKIKIGTLPPIFANNAAAITGGLTAGHIYRSGSDPDNLYIVH